MSKTKYKKQNKKGNKYYNESLLQMQTSLEKEIKEKRTGYIIPTIKCYPTNGQLRDPDLTRHKLYYPNQQHYLQHPILWVVLNVCTIVLRTRLIRLQSQHSIKQAGLTTHSKTSLVRNSDNIKYQTQTRCNENPSLKSTDLFQTQRFIER